MSRSKPQQLFPFTLYAEETPHFTSSSYDFRGVFLANKPAELTWFAYDVVIHSPTRIEFMVYDMRDTFFGGLGNIIANFSATVPATLTLKHMERQAMRLARARREEELLEAERKIMRGYAADYLRQMKKAA
jgi:hypothetical protein